MRGFDRELDTERLPLDSPARTNIPADRSCLIERSTDLKSYGQHLRKEAHGRRMLEQSGVHPETVINVGRGEAAVAIRRNLA
jgi:hypothetical protein